jgi:hypothetical protein
LNSCGQWLDTTLIFGHVLFLHLELNFVKRVKTWKSVFTAASKIERLGM